MPGHVDESVGPPADEEAECDDHHDAGHPLLVVGLAPGHGGEGGQQDHGGQDKHHQTAVPHPYILATKIDTIFRGNCYHTFDNG